MSPPQQGTPRERKVQISPFYVEPETREKFNALCAAGGMSQAGLQRWFVDEMIRTTAGVPIRDQFALLQHARTVVETLTTGDETEAVAA